MMSENEYFKFSKKVAKMLKTCFICVEHPKEILDSETKLKTFDDSTVNYSGNSSLTKDNKYYFNQWEAKNHRDKLIEICESLPKLKTIISGTAGTISYTDLLPDRKTDTISLTQHCEHADKFIGLLIINGIGYTMTNRLIGNEQFKSSSFHLFPFYTEKENIKYLNIDDIKEEELNQRIKQISKYYKDLSIETIQAMAIDSIRTAYDTVEIKKLQDKGYSEESALHFYFESDINRISSYIVTKKMNDAQNIVESRINPDAE